MNIDSKKAVKQLRILEKYTSSLRLAAEGWSEPWKSLVSTMLSARTRDETTIKVCNELFSKYPSLQQFSKAKLLDIRKIIKPVNYYKTKSKNVLECSKIVVEKFNSRLPLDFDKLITLPGVGRKTANVFLSEMGKDAIGVDTHCLQLSNKLGWSKSSKPELVENDLKELFPKNIWKEVNPILVRFGRTFRGKKQDLILKEILKN